MSAALKCVNTPFTFSYLDENIHAISSTCSQRTPSRRIPFAVPRELLRIAAVRHRLHETAAAEQPELLRRRISEHQYLSLDPALSKRRALGGRGNAKRSEPKSVQLPPNPHRAMSVSVGLENRHERAAERQHRLECPHIVPQRRSLLHDLGRNADIAEMPCLIGDAGDLFFSFQIAQHKAIARGETAKGSANSLVREHRPNEVPFGAVFSQINGIPVWCSLWPGFATYCAANAAPCSRSVLSQIRCCSSRERQPLTATMPFQPSICAMSCDKSVFALRSSKTLLHNPARSSEIDCAFSR